MWTALFLVVVIAVEAVMERRRTAKRDSLREAAEAHDVEGFKKG